MNDLVLDHVTKVYGDKTVLKDFAHTFPAGRVTAITGPSGCGKTTLLRLIAGLEKPDSGTITGVPDKVAVVFQEDRLCEEFSAVSNVRFVTGNTLSRDEIIGHLAELSLADDTKKPVGTFSGGMKRRVAIARALCYDADCVLLDEPFKGLDEVLKKSVMDYVLAHTTGKTVICVTHDPAEAAYLGGERLVMEAAAR